MQTIILIFHVIIAVFLVALVLVQQGKGADIGASFGGGSSNTMFGSVGPAPFLMKLTCVLGAIFFITSLSMGYLEAHRTRPANQLIVPTKTMTQPFTPPTESQKKK